eukprot:12271039-Alexandrium_andersonii.AAC.1
MGSARVPEGWATLAGGADAAAQVGQARWVEGGIRAGSSDRRGGGVGRAGQERARAGQVGGCLLYTSPSPRD